MYRACTLSSIFCFLENFASSLKWIALFEIVQVSSQCAGECDCWYWRMSFFARFFPLPSLFLVPLVSSIRSWSWNSMRRTFYERNFPNENKTSANKMCCKRKTFSLHTFCWAKELWMWTDNTSKLSNVRCCSALWMCFEKARRKEQKCIAWQNSYVYFTSIKCTWIGIGVKFLLIAFYRSEQRSLMWAQTIVCHRFSCIFGLM